MKLGIVGLPNVGKSTLFNAITNAGVPADNYAFCTIDPNVGVVSVPDERLQWLSDLRNYGEVLRDVAVGQPVFLTKNGHGRYAVLDMEEYRQYEKLMAMQKLITELEKGRRSGQEQGYFSLEDVEKELGIHD